ncbi:MAG: AI-2E family transporter [Sulfurimonas sp.]|nr:AI-2E family transporter [Sulfurimonas sp.]
MQQKKIGYYFIVMASVVIVLAGAKVASEIIVPFLLSLFIAIILSPSYNFFNKKGLPNFLSLTIVIIIFIVFILLVAKLIGSSAQEFSSNIDFYNQQLISIFTTFTAYVTKIGIEIPFEDISNIINIKQIMNFSTTLIKSIGSLLANGFVILLTVIFMILESKYFIKKLEYVSLKSLSVSHAGEIMNQIKEYMVLKALISLLTGFIIWIVLTLVGTDYAFLWATLAFLLNFIPNIGSIIAAVPAVLLTLIQLGGMSALIVGITYMIVNIVIGSIIEPKIMGKGLGLSTLVVFLSLIFWGWLFGMIGMLLSIPLTIMAKIIFNANENTKWIAVFLGTGESLSNSKKLNIQ